MVTVLLLTLETPSTDLKRTTGSVSMCPSESAVTIETRTYENVFINTFRPIRIQEEIQAIVGVLSVLFPAGYPSLCRSAQCLC